MYLTALPLSIQVFLLLCRHRCFCWMSYTAGNLRAAHLRYVSRQMSKGGNRMLPAAAASADMTCKLDTSYMQGMSVAGKHNLGMLQRQDLAAAAPVKQVLEAPELFELMEALLQVSKHPVVDIVCPLRICTVCAQTVLLSTCTSQCQNPFLPFLCCCDILVYDNTTRS